VLHQRGYDDVSGDLKLLYQLTNNNGIGNVDDLLWCATGAWLLRHTLQEGYASDRAAARIVCFDPSALLLA
jgi:hypothetical protein